MVEIKPIKKNGINQQAFIRSKDQINNCVIRKVFWPHNFFSAHCSQEATYILKIPHLKCEKKTINQYNHFSAHIATFVQIDEKFLIK